MAGQTFTINMKAILDASNVKGSINNIQSALDGLKLPANITKGFQDTFSKLSAEVKNFEALSNKGIKNTTDFKKVETSANKIIALYEKLKVDAKDVKGLDVSKLFPQSTVDTITKANTALNNYSNSLKDVSKQLDTANKKIGEWQAKLNQRQSSRTVYQTEIDNANNELAQATAALTSRAQLDDVDEAYQKISADAEKAAAAVQEYNSREKVNASYAKGLQTKANNLKQLVDNYDKAKQAAENANIAFEANEKAIEAANKKTVEWTQKQQEAQSAFDKQQNSSIQTLYNDLSKLNGIDLSSFDGTFESAANAVSKFIDKNGSQARGQVEGFIDILEKEGVNVDNLRAKLEAASIESQRFDERMRDIGAFKSRIQYFLGLNNAINLIKRAIRGAVATIKDLDKAMTETAVVTDFTVSDMWKQLPEYTKRANELGVTTQQAYESATLFYQQGLNTQQAAALSTETLKMARIAGLDAAEATDRMTNALRGFNMELDAQSAQRVDDVYSQLAAHTASNVDEISTAMTKVASLAHSANMEFETTAAFLAQIIETTRESAETAGTALKTVVARFSEVKKLYSEDQLKGTDEEGQVIDVNRIGIALRTAGIDLNKYFLGEVGLDDIFMELASKWDSLTGVQQRYIATQAAGSRQQSRFIALMQDYARTQELVGMAYDANGASAKQFEKTQDSLQSKLARLKNAWNEFLMGLANSSIVKGVVDVLTTILNLVNKITSAFGNGIGTIFKWGVAFVAFKGLKTLFKDGGLASQALGKLIPIFGGDTTKGAAALNAAATTAATTTTTAATAAATTTTTAATQAAAILVKGAAEAAAIEKGSAVDEGVIENTSAIQAAEIQTTGAIVEEAIEAKGSLLSRIFNATPIGGGEIIGGGAGIPAGGLTGGFSALSIAGFGAALVALEVGAVALQDYVTSGQAQVDHAERVVKKQEKQVEDAVDATKKQKEAYEAYVKNEKIAQTATGVEKAQAEANMAEAAEVLYNIDVNNVIQTDDGFTVNKGYAAQRDETLKQQERLEKAELALDEARVALAQEEVSLGKQYSVVFDNEAGSITQGQAYAQAKSGSLWESQKHQLDSSKSQQELELEAEVWNSKQRAEAEGFAAQATQKMAESAVALLDGVVKDQNIIDTVSTAYAEALDKEAYSKDVVDIQSDLNDLIKIAQDENGKILLDVLNGSYEGLISDNELETIFKDLPKEYADTLESILTSSGDDVSTALKKFNAKLKKSQLNFRKSAIATLYKNGLQTGEQLDRIANELTLTEQKKLVDVADSLTDYGKDFNNILLTAISDQMLEGTYDNSSLQKFVQQLSDNPILTFDALSKAANAAESDVQTLAKNLLAITRESEAFSKKNQVQWFLAEGMEDLNDEVEKFIEENGKLNSHNIESLAKQSKTLAALLENDVISAKALAAAMNALQEGKVTIFDLNESVLELYESFDTVANAIERAGQFIKDFDPGEDWGDAFDFIETGIDKLTEFVDNRELGNPQARNYWKAFFTTDPQDLADWEAGIALLKQLQGNSGANFWTDIVGFKMDKNGNIEDMGIEGFAQSEFNSYQKYIQSLAGEKGKQFTDDYYDLMIRNAANHDYGFLTDIASVEVSKIAEAYGKGLEGGKPLDKNTIQAIADGYGLDPQELLNAYTEKFNLDHIDFSSLQDKVRETYTSLSDVVNEAVSQGMVNAPTTQPKNLLPLLGIDENGTFSIDTLKARIGQIVPEVADGSISVEDWIQEQIDQAPDSKITLPVEYEVVTKNEKTGNFETQTIKAEVEVSNLDEYSHAIEQIQSAADTELLGSSLTAAFNEGQTAATSLADFIKTIGEDNSIHVIQGEISNCQADATTLNDTLGQDVHKNVYVDVSPRSISISVEGQSISFSTTTAALGGIVRSYAAGSNNIRPGLALTGEEAPEIVWNKEKGYAYLAGTNGPEINNLQPGDQVFNGDQTKQILKRSGLQSFAKGSINSYAGTIWKLDEPSNNKGGGSGSGSSDKDEDDEWKNEIDWLYNVVQNIEELERQQNILQEEYNDLLTDQTKTGQDLYKMLIQQLGNLYAQLDHQTYALEKREQEMREFMDTTNDMDDYLWYNWNDRTIEIDWDKIDQITDEEQYNHIKELIDQAEDIQDKMDDAEDAIIDVNNAIQDLENIWRDTFVDFEDRVLKAVIKMYQTVIDNYSELNDTLNDSNTAILDAINKEISLQRQIRDNTKTEEEIANDEAQLAYLRRDTTGGNDLAALQLEKELNDQRQNYEDNLIDQAVQRLQDDNDAAAAQREKQIEIMQAQLDYQSENGEFNQYIRDLMDTAIDGDGHLATDSDLYKLLAEQENADAMTKVGREVWEEELNGTFKEVMAFLLKEQGEAEGTYFTAVTAAFQGVQDQFDKFYHGSYSQGSVHVGSSSSSSGGGSGGGSNNSTKPAAKPTPVAMPTIELTVKAEEPKEQRIKGVGSTALKGVKVKGGWVTYDTGGLADSTGPAWLDGTKNAPEYVLNAKQTDAFLRLADVLPAAMNNTGSSVSNTFGSTTNNIVINVDKIDSDYSVDQMVARVKESLFESGSYRNNNVLNFLR